LLLLQKADHVVVVAEGAKRGAGDQGGGRA
jgi:hypothetical protein